MSTLKGEEVHEHASEPFLALLLLGMSTQGTKKCTIVPPNHFGPIPGVPVGTSWLFRIGCCEAGVHRPPVAGIAGKAEYGAVSIVLSGQNIEMLLVFVGERGERMKSRLMRFT